MRVFCLAANQKGVHRLVGGLLLSSGLLAACSAYGQDAPNAPQPQSASVAPASRGETFGGIDYLRGASFVRGPIAPYKAHHVPSPNLSNSPRIDQMMRDGKVYLSVSDAIALALENNLDLAIARYNLPIADTDILRTKAGGSPRGVATGLVQELRELCSRHRVQDRAFPGSIRR
jgi:hypothetical protein